MSKRRAVTREARGSRTGAAAPADPEHVDRTGARAELAQAVPHRAAARCLAIRAACSGSSPQASRAASTEEWVQPEPCAAPSG